MGDPAPPKLGDLFQPIDRSWWDAMSDASKIAYLTYLKRTLNFLVVSDEISEGLEAVMAIGSPTVDDWYLSRESPNCPGRERLD